MGATNASTCRDSLLRVSDPSVSNGHALRCCKLEGSPRVPESNICIWRKILRNSKTSRDRSWCHLHRTRKPIGGRWYGYLSSLRSSFSALSVYERSPNLTASKLRLAAEVDAVAQASMR